jgi:hypothetical protein
LDGRDHIGAVFLFLKYFLNILFYFNNLFLFKKFNFILIIIIIIIIIKFGEILPKGDIGLAVCIRQYIYILKNRQKVAQMHKTT